ncbi:MAG: isoprenylcysteine carboxylmethyltransferase family protein [Gammaproteobacteria bacterium]|nr:isoprenylcysteine carboxylmethyltransferase family protein [Gammaproteobacteria bacterium]
MIDSGQGPAWLTAVSVWIYWISVAFKAARMRIRGQGKAGLFPKQTLERLMWLAWVPVITGWVLFPWFTITQSDAIWQLVPASVSDLRWLALRWAAAGIVLICLLATLFCWHWMGQNWRVGVDTDTQTSLVTDGPFSRIRHPIYTLSILMMLASYVAVPIHPMLFIALLHLILMYLKAGNEESWLIGVYGNEYEIYRNRAGRFLPKWSRRS